MEEKVLSLGNAILKIKMQPVSINAAANYNEHILWFDDAMSTLFV